MSSASADWGSGLAVSLSVGSKGKNKTFSVKNETMKKFRVERKFLGLSAFHCCDKTLKINNLKEGRLTI
jgi:hypothetical protein